MIAKADMPKLLGRSLTSLEDSNYTLYLDSAARRLDTLLCMDTSSDETTRTYKSRIGYSEIKIEPFTVLSEVLVDGEAVTDYEIKRGDSYNSSWCNTIEFAGRFDEEVTVTVTGTWGFGNCPSDLQFLVAKLFNLVTTERGVSGQIKSRSIEDVSVTYDSSVSPLASLTMEYGEVIAHYSACSSYIRSGSAGRTTEELSHARYVR